jgi:hypothetical protein
LDGLTAVFRFADHIYVLGLVEQRAQTLPYDRVIIHQQHRYFFHNFLRIPISTGAIITMERKRNNRAYSLNLTKR